jgi:hypothetical protein
MAPDWANWSSSSCSSLAAAGGSLVLTQNEPCSVASPNAIAGLAPPNVLCGDFDVQVDFAVTGLVAGVTGGIFASMRANDPTVTTNGMTIERYAAEYVVPSSQSYQNYKSYTTNKGDDATSLFVATTDVTGRLRLTRAGTTVKSYYWKTGAPDGQWVLVNTATLSSTPWTLVLYEGDNSAANKGPTAPYSVTFSNLLVTFPGATDAGTGSGSDAGTSGSGSDSSVADAGISSPVSSVVGVTCDTTPRAGFATIVTAKDVYLVEGIPDDTPTPLSSTAMIGRSTDGGLDPATCTSTSAVTVPVAEYSMGVASVANAVYLIGGNTTGVTTTQSAVYRADIANGSLSSFRVATLPGDGGVTPVVLQTSRYGQQVVQTQNYIYVIGGWSSVGQTNVASIERAQVDPLTGDFVTNFAPAINPSTGGAATMAVPRFNTVAVQLGSWVYILGGQTDIGSAGQCHNEIQRAGLDANGNLSSFSQVGTLPNPLCGPATYVTNNTLYVLGGVTAVNSPGNPIATDAVLEAAIAADGTLGAFASSSVKLAYPVGWAGSATFGNTVYLFNGFKGTTGATTSIQAITFP